MKTESILSLIIVFTLSVTSFAVVEGTDLEKKRPLAGNNAVADILKNIQDKHPVPAIACAIVTSRGVFTLAAVGALIDYYRKYAAI